MPTQAGPRAAGLTIVWVKRGTGAGASDLLPGGLGAGDEAGLRKVGRAAGCTT